MADALAAAKRRRDMLSGVVASTTATTTPVRKRSLQNLKEIPNNPSSASTMSSSLEKVTPDPKAVRKDAEPRVLFGRTLD